MDGDLGVGAREGGQEGGAEEGAWLVSDVWMGSGGGGRYFMPFELPHLSQ